MKKCSFHPYMPAIHNDICGCPEQAFCDESHAAIAVYFLQSVRLAVEFVMAELVTIRNLGGAATSVITEKFEGRAALQVEVKRRDQEKVAKTKKADEVVAKQVADNGAKDYKPFPPEEVADPGRAEVKSSIASLKPGWTAADHKTLISYIPTRHPPTDLSAAEIAQIRWIAQREIESDPMMKLMVSGSTGSLATLLDKFVPIHWLDRMFDRTHTSPTMRQRITFDLGRRALSTSPGDMWRAVKIYHNGNVKNLLEALFYAEKYGLRSDNCDTLTKGGKRTDDEDEDDEE